MAAKRDYYEVLGVLKNASPEEIKRAYRRMAVKNHPDKNPGDKAAEAAFKECAEAHEILSDPGKKSRYDQSGYHSVSGEAEAARGRSMTIFDDVMASYFPWWKKPTTADEVRKSVMGIDYRSLDTPYPGLDLIGSKIYYALALTSSDGKTAVLTHCDLFANGSSDPGIRMNFSLNIPQDKITEAVERELKAAGFKYKRGKGAPQRIDLSKQRMEMEYVARHLRFGIDFRRDDKDYTIIQDNSVNRSAICLWDELKPEPGHDSHSSKLFKAGSYWLEASHDTVVDRRNNLPLPGVWPGEATTGGELYNEQVAFSEALAGRLHELFFRIAGGVLPDVRYALIQPETNLYRKGLLPPNVAHLSWLYGEPASVTDTYLFGTSTIIFRKEGVEGTEEARFKDRTPFIGAFIREPDTNFRADVYAIEVMRRLRNPATVEQVKKRFEMEWSKIPVIEPPKRLTEQPKMEMLELQPQPPSDKPAENKRKERLKGGGR
jgi:hypothetical protein